MTATKTTEDCEPAHLEALDLVTRQMAAAVARCSRDFRYLWVSQAYADWLQCPVHDLIGRPISDVLGKNAFDALLPHFNRVLAGQRVQYEHETHFRGIGRRWISADYTPTFDRNGGVNGWMAVVLDITQRRQAEIARLEHAAIVESSVDAIISKDLNAIITSWNSGAERMFGYTEAEAVGQPITLLIPPELWDEENRILEKLKSGGRIEHFETTRATKAGRYVDVSLTIGPISDSTGRLLGFAKIAHDITDRKRAERAVRESEALLKIFVKNVPAGVAMLDREMRYLQVSDRWCADYGVDGFEIIGRSHYDVFPDLPERWRDVHRRALAGETVRADEDRWDRRDGAMWIQWEVRPWRNIEGVQGGILIFAVDISRHKEMEDALREAGRRLMESQEEERARIGRELHDDISQRLAMLTVEVDGLREHDSTSASERQRRVIQIRRRLVEISRGVQSLSQQLYSPHVELIGIAAAMRGFCKDFEAGRNVDIQFEADTISRIPASGVSLCLFRVLQEALHNAAKHSRVRQFEVKLTCSNDELGLMVSDRGAGFDIGRAIKTGGLGLNSMRERVRQVQGTISIDSKPRGGGTTIHVRVPLSLARTQQQRPVS